MKIKRLSAPLLFVFLITATAFGQSSLLKRTSFKTDKLDFGVGGTLSVIGAPNGSIRIEGWSSREIEINAEIVIEAASEADLNLLSKVIGFVTEESLSRTGIVTTGTHDKKFMKAVDKKFPKTLIGLPFAVNYVIKVPRYCDLQIDGGKGGLSISGVEGNFKINYLESDAKIELVGGGIFATIGKGTLDISIPMRGWRGRFADVQMATGTLSLTIPTGLNAEFDATILRTGKIENGYSGFVPRSRKFEFTDKSIAAKSGLGSIPLKFTVGDGNMIIKEIGKPS